MSNSTEQPGLAYVFADREQNYYLIPGEDFERGRVPAERKAEIEQGLREHSDDAVGFTVNKGRFAAGLVLNAAVGGLPLALIFVGTVAVLEATSGFALPPGGISRNDPALH